MDYKKIVRKQSTRLFILRYLSWVPDKLMLKLQYRIKMGIWPDFKNPRRFTEKIQLYKMKYRNSILPQCVDKYEVRNYIQNKGLSYILNELYAVYDSPSDIDFEKLPDSFVLKTTTGGGGLNVIIVQDKKKLDQQSVIDSLTRWCSSNKKRISSGREWAYTGITRPRIVVEKFLSDPTNPFVGINDYKILCFNGSPEYIIVDVNRFVNHKRDIYDSNWKRINVTTDHKQTDEGIEPPANLNHMLDIARNLASDFPFVRVDLYNVQNRIVFGELTFYPWSGYVKFDPDVFDFVLGGKWPNDSYL